jgi:carboxypeptidase family protein
MRRPVLSVLALLTSTGIAAQQTTGDIQGRVLGSRSQPLSDVQVTVTSPSLQGDRRTLSDARGAFRLLALPPGAFTLRLSRIGYRPLVIEQVAVRLGHIAALGEITLPEQATELPPLVVTANRPAIDPNTSSVGTEVSATAIEQLPIGRDYRSIITLLPQANESYLGDGVNISGGTGLENAYFLDGVNVTEPYRGDGGIDLPLNFIDYLQLKTGGYEPEYGRALGGIVNVVTRTGGDARSVSAFGFFTGSGLASRPERGLVDQGKGDYTRYDVGMSVGGPIRRQRLWYFVAYDGAVERQHVHIPGSEVALDHGVTHKFAAKLNWRADPATSLVFIAVGDPATRDIVGNPFFAPFVPPGSLANPDPFLGYWNEGGVSVALRGDHLAGGRTHLGSAVSYATSWQQNGGRTARGRTEPLFSDDLTATWSGGYANRWDRTSSRLAASLTADWVLGEHSLKGGAQYEDNGLREDWQWRSNGPDSAGWLERVDTNLYVTLPLDFRTTVHNRIVSFFVQGSYRATPWLRLNPGLRWDGQFFTGPQGRSGSITDQVQPRVGVVVHPGGSTSQKVTASYGRFYEQVPNLTTSFLWGGLHQEFPIYTQDPRVDTAGRIAYPDSVRAADHLRGQHYDEFTLSYEREAGVGSIIQARAVYRILREILTTADSLQVDPNSPITVGANPGAEPLAFLPRPHGYYVALELTAQKLDGSPLNFQFSYVLSRHYGNYVGLYDQDAGVGNPNSGTNFSNPAELKNATGLLPNDRTHVFKAFGSYRVGPRLAVGSYVILQSGTPLNYFGAAPDPYSFDFAFLKPRGTAGRTPWLWDVNLRLRWTPGSAVAPRWYRITLDAFHLFSGKRPVLIDQKAFLHQDATGTQTTLNPSYGQVLLRQPPMTLRVGLQLGR